MMSKINSFQKDEVIALKSNFGFPDSWAIEVAQHAFNEVRDGTHDSPQDAENGVPLVTSKNLINGMIDFSNTKTISFEDHLEISKRSGVNYGDILFSMIGTIGNVAIVPETTDFSVKNVGLFRRNDLLLHRRFAFYWLKSQPFQKYLEERQRGGNQKFVSLGILRESPVPIAPLAEQKVIADKLDALLAQVETTKARLERIPEIIKRFRQSVLAAAVSGRLTAEWRANNGISLEKWVPENLGALAEVATGKTPSRKIPEYWENGTVPWLTSAATGKSLAFEAEQYVTERAVKECTLKIFPPGTLLLAMYGEGKTRGQVTELRLAATCNQACAAILVNESKVTKDFLKIRLEENYEETRNAAVGGAQPNLNLNKVREISIQLPSTDEQTEIVRRVEQLFAFADTIEQKAKAALERVNNLTQSILAKAFRGELTAEWRAANPDLIGAENSASALLERIKAEREIPQKRRKGS